MVDDEGELCLGVAVLYIVYLQQVVNWIQSFYMMLPFM